MVSTRRLGPAAAVVVALATLTACGGQDAPGCRIAQVITLPPGALATSDEVRLERAGPDLLVLGTDSRRDQIRLGRLDPAGSLVAEAAVMVPPRTLGPFYAATARTVPGDQLLVVYGVAHPSGGTAVALQLIVHTAGTQTPTAPVPLRDPEGNDVVVDSVELDVAMGTSRSGRRAVLAWGNRTQAGPPTMLLLNADGSTARSTTPASLSTAAGSAPWNCLAVTAGRGDFGLSRMIRRPGARPAWAFVDFADDGAASYSLEVEAPHDEIGCPVVGPTAGGYTFAWQNRDGSYFGDVDAVRGTAPLVTTDIVRAAVHFGGPDAQPPLSCVASMGRDYAFVFGGATGPLIHRFDVFGAPRGGQLRLPGRGRNGPPAAWPDLGSAHVTYLDRGATAADDRRQLVRVDCPVDPS